MLYLHGVGKFHPENIIDNEFLTRLNIGTNDSWILERVGIVQRRTVLPLDYIFKTKNHDPKAASEVSVYSNVQTARAATLACLELARRKESEIGLVIAGGCSPQYLIPAEACMVASELGITCPSFDLNSACSSFIAQLHFLLQFKPEALPDFVLLLNIENNTRVVDYSDRGTAVLWGDATSATLVSPRIPAPMKIQRSSFESDPSGWNKVRIPGHGFFQQEGPSVQKFAIQKTGILLKEHLEASAQLRGGSDYFIGHQANLVMLQSVVQRSGISPEKHLFNVDRFGNGGSAGPPSVLAENWDRFRSGDRVFMAAVGSGLSWGSLTIAVGEAN